MSTEQRVKQRIAEILRVGPDRVTNDTALAHLVSESFVLVEMAIELQEDFSVRLVQEDLNSVQTVGDLATMISARTVS